MNISIIGSGGWGTALAVLLEKNDHKVCMWSYDRDECKGLELYRENRPFLPGIAIGEGVRFSNDLSEAAQSGVIITSTPSAFMLPVARALKPFIDGQLIVNVSKGFIKIDERYVSIAEMLADTLCTERVSVLTGPSHAEEVGRGAPTVCVAASRCKADAELIQDIFMCGNFRVYSTPDIVGAELGGSLKNVIALAAGICDGMGLGDNAKAALMTRGLTEMARLGVAMGGRSETFAGLTGIGDLIVTCNSVHSRNRRAGILIGEGTLPGDAVRQIGTVEGYYAAEAAAALSEEYNVDMPIARTVYSILYAGKKPGDAIRDLMTRAPKHEIEETWMADIKWP